MIWPLVTAAVLLVGAGVYAVGDPDERAFHVWVLLALALLIVNTRPHD